MVLRRQSTARRSERAARQCPGRSKGGERSRLPPPTVKPAFGRVSSSLSSCLRSGFPSKVARVKPAGSAHVPSATPQNRARVAYLVYRVERRLRSRLDEVTRTEGVTTTEYVTLSVLRERDGMSSAELARWA